MENIIAVKEAAPITLPLPTGMFEGDGERREKERRFCAEYLRNLGLFGAEGFFRQKSHPLPGSCASPRMPKTGGNIHQEVLQAATGLSHKSLQTQVRVISI